MKQKKLPITFQGTLRLRNTNQISFWSTNSRENSSSVLGQTRCTTVHQFISHRGQDRYTKKEKALMTIKKPHGGKRYHSNIIQRGTSFQQPQNSPSLEGGVGYPPPPPRGRPSSSSRFLELEHGAPWQCCLSSRRRVSPDCKQTNRL